jgi:hypothetical protein
MAMPRFGTNPSSREQLVTEVALDIQVPFLPSLLLDCSIVAATGVTPSG